MTGRRLETTILGRTRLTVSRLGFGGAPAGLTNYLGAYRPEHEDQRQEVLAAIEVAVQEGITYFDTAADYGDGTSEKLFGEALAVHGGSVTLASKVSNHMPVRESVERSLHNLRRERLDIVQIHGTVIHETQAMEILAAGGMLDQLCDLQSEGLVRYIGFTSEANNAAVYRFIDSGRFDIMQIAYNFLNQHPYDPVRPFGSLLEAEEREMGTVTMRTLTSGLFQKWVRHANPGSTFDYTPHLLQYVLSNPLVDVALVGMRTRSEVRMNAAITRDIPGRIDLDELHERYV